MGESETARTPVMGSGVGATAAMVEAVDRDRVDGDIGPGDTLHAPPQRSRPTPGKGDKWRTEHPTHVASPICVTAGSPGAGPLRCPVWRQSRRRSPTPGVTPRTATTVDGQGYKLAGDPGETPPVQVVLSAFGASCAASRRLTTISCIRRRRSSPAARPRAARG